MIETTLLSIIRSYRQSGQSQKSFSYLWAQMRGVVSPSVFYDDAPQTE
jgi:hypothetical protein